MEIKINDRYKVRSDGSLNWMPYRLSEPREEGGERRWQHMGTYHQTLQDCLLSLYRKEAIEDGQVLGSIEEAVKVLRGFEREIVEAVQSA